MELDEMKSLWEGMSKELDRQKVLTDTMILQITRMKYRDKLRGISVSEGIGTLVCLAMAVIILYQLPKLDTWYLLLCGIFSLVFCITLPLLSLNAIHRMRRIDVTTMSYKEVIRLYASGKEYFVKVQKAGFYLGIVFAIAILPVFMKLFKGRDLFLEFEKFFWYIPVLLTFHLFFSRYVFKKYRSVTTSAQRLLEELKE